MGNRSLTAQPSPSRNHQRKKSTKHPVDKRPLNAAERRILTEAWHLLITHAATESTINDAWLLAAEMSPTWLWGLVGVDETMQSSVENVRFRSMITSAARFLHQLIRTKRLDAATIADRSCALGERHRAYFDFGAQSAYWEAFPVAFARVVAQRCDQLGGSADRHGSTLNCWPSMDIPSQSSITGENSSSTGGGAGIVTIESAAHRFMTVVVDAMRYGYMGGVSIPVRLSLTSSIISLTSLRSNRSRSLLPPITNYQRRDTSPRSSLLVVDNNSSRFGGVDYSPTTIIDDQPPLTRTHSILRARPAIRSSVSELNALRRLSSPCYMATSVDLLCYIPAKPADDEDRLNQHRRRLTRSASMKCSRRMHM